MLSPVSLSTPDGGRIAIGLPGKTGAFKTSFQVYRPGSDEPRLNVEADAFIGGFGTLSATGRDLKNGQRFSLSGVFPQIGVESFDLSRPECMSVRRDRYVLPDSKVVETTPGFLEHNGLVGLTGYALQCALPVAAGLLAGSIAGFVTGHPWLGGGLLAATVPCALMAASRPAAI